MKQEPKRDTASADDHKLLQDCENTIRAGVKHFLAVGQALHTIRNKLLYRLKGYRTFEQYCQKEWNITSRHATNLIATFDFNIRIGTDVPIPDGLRRRMEKLPKEEQDAIEKECKTDLSSMRMRVAEAEQRQKTAYLAIRGYVTKIDLLLSRPVSIQAEEDKIYNALAPCEEWRKQYRERKQRLEQDREEFATV